MSRLKTTGGITRQISSVRPRACRIVSGLRSRRTTTTRSASWDTIRAQGFDETFRRMWEFYLAYCEAGFRTGYLDVFQLSMARPAEG